MNKTNILAQIRHFVTSYLASSEKERQIMILESTIVLLSIFSLPLLIAYMAMGHEHAIYALVIANLGLLGAWILVRQGHTTLVANSLPILLIATVTYTATQKHGIHDTILLSFPMIVAVGGLVQKKHGLFLLASLEICCVWLIYLLELNGHISPGLAGYTTPSVNEPIIITILLWLTAVFIYFTTSSLMHSLQSIQSSESALIKANKDLEEYASILKKRTEHLLTGARVSRAATSILEPNELSQQVVDMVCERFELYYVGLFLVDATKKWAVLRAGTGEAGRQMLASGHKLRIGNTSMIGWCIANQKARIALDVGQEAVRFDNPLLPRTRSELALPLISRGEVIGALSIQSDQEAAFTEEDIVSFQTMADHLANAIQNAQLYDQLQKELKQRRHAENEVRKLNKELENRVAERTKELQAANERLTTLSRLKDEFVANVSHELRTPITSIMLYHSLIEKSPEQARLYISSLKRETQRLAHLIEDLLYLSRLEQGRINFNPDTIDINKILRDYVTDREPMAQQRQLDLVLETDPSLPTIRADEQMIGQVVSILLTNAMNYTPAPGKITIRSTIKQEEKQTWVGFSVQDTGLGLAPEDKERLFERFFRGKAGRESAAPGTGLGLAIAKEIMDRHGGRIEVQSEGPGKGACFSVWLPLAG